MKNGTAAAVAAVQLIHCHRVMINLMSFNKNFIDVFFIDTSKKSSLF